MQRNALITGASRGLGAALARRLSEDGWSLVVDARTDTQLSDLADALPGPVIAEPGDITDPLHRARLIEVVQSIGGLDLLVNNAGTLGPTPLPRLEAVDPDAFSETLRINTVAQLALFQAVGPALTARGGTVVNISSDAAVAAYPGWGAYGASKAALDQLSAVLAVEHPDLRVWAVDPGDMSTEMHQAAFPGEDISDRPPPSVAADAIVRLLAQRPPSGRIRAADLAEAR